MSRHHIETDHANRAREIRRRIAAQLPLPCIECGRAVMPGTRWHVAHIQPAMMGGRTTVTNTGPAHPSCNLRAGGRMGAAVTNPATRAADIRNW